MPPRNRGAGGAPEGIPAQGGSTTTATNGQVLANILTTISKEQCRYVGVIASDDTSDGTYATSASTAGVFARSPEALAPVRAWEGIDIEELAAPKLKAWTDDYSDILGPFLSKLRR